MRRARLQTLLPPARAIRTSFNCSDRRRPLQREPATFHQLFAASRPVHAPLLRIGIASDDEGLHANDARAGRTTVIRARSERPMPGAKHCCGEDPGSRTARRRAHRTGAAGSAGNAGGEVRQQSPRSMPRSMPRSTNAPRHTSPKRPVVGGGGDRSDCGRRFASQSAFPAKRGRHRSSPRLACPAREPGSCPVRSIAAGKIPALARLGGALTALARPARPGMRVGEVDATVSTIHATNCESTATHDDTAVPWRFIHPGVRREWKLTRPRRAPPAPCRRSRRGRRRWRSAAAPPPARRRQRGCRDRARGRRAP